MRIKILNGILIVDILSALLVICIVYIPSSIARAVLGLPFLLFFPGYTLVAVLFVKKEIGAIERVALSCVLSVAIAGIIGFGLNYTSWGITLVPALYSIAGFVGLMSAITLILKARILKTNIFTTELSFRFSGWGPNTLNRFLSIILIAMIFGALGVLGYTIAVPRIGETYTEFYMLGINGRAQDYPGNYVIDNGTIIQVTYGNGVLDTNSGMGIVTLGIVNHEHQTVEYTIKMTIDDEPVNIDLDETTTDMVGPIVLRSEEKWEKEIGIVPVHEGENQKVKFLLYKGGQIDEDNYLLLLVSVKSGNEE